MKREKVYHIVLEGVDRVGKSSIWQELNKQGKYKHFIQDRGTIGFLAYCEIFGRSEELISAYESLENKLSEIEEIVIIYLTASNEVLMDRCEISNHEFIDYENHKKSYYSKFCQSPYKKKMLIDTSNRTAEETAKLILKQFELLKFGGE